MMTLIRYAIWNKTIQLWVTSQESSESKEPRLFTKRGHALMSIKQLKKQYPKAYGQHDFVIVPCRVIIEEPSA